MRLTLPSAAGLAFLAGCTGDGTNTGGNHHPDPGDGGTSSPFYSVLKDCPDDAGNLCPWAGSGNGGWAGDGDRYDTWFSFPMSVAFPPEGSDAPPVMSDWNNHKLRALEPDGTTKTVMGTDFLGDGDPALADRTPDGAQGTDVALNHPTQQMYYPDGTLLSDSWHTHKFRSWDPATGIVHVVLGSRPGINTEPDDGDSTTPLVVVEQDQPAASVLMNQPKELFIDPSNPKVVYYVDMRNERIRKWDQDAGTIDTIAGETVDSADTDTVVGSKGWCGTDDDEALLTCFSFPKNANPEPGGAIAVTSDGKTMYVGDTEAHVIREIDLTADPVRITLLSGTPNQPGFADGDAAGALWNYPSDFALDEANHALYVADTNNHRVRMIDLDSNEVSTVAGTGEPSCPLAADELLIPQVCDNQSQGGDGGPATEATLYRPFGVDIDNDGNLVIADTYDQRFRILYR